VKPQAPVMIEPDGAARKRYLVGVLIVLASEYLLRTVFLTGGTTSAHVGSALVLEWVLLALLLVVWVPRIEHRGMASIGFGHFKRRYLWLGALAYSLATAVLTLTGFLLPLVGLQPISSLQPMLQDLGLPVLLGLFVTGTFLEEVFYRGYLIERVISLTGRPWVAGAVSWLAFTLVHLVFFGLGPTIDVSVLSAALVFLYLKERSIWPCVVLHGLNNAFAYLIIPLLLNLQPRV